MRPSELEPRGREQVLLPAERSWLREGAVAALLFALLREWLVPIAQLSDAAGDRVLIPMLVAIGAFVLADYARLPWTAGAFVKLLAAWLAIGWIYDKEGLASFRWLSDYMAITGKDAGSMISGDLDLIGGENRTLLFLIGWALLASVVQTLLTIKKHSFWFVGATLVYLIGLQLWPGLDTAAAVVRVLLAGLLMMALQQLPRVEQTYAADSGTQGWPIGWLVPAVGLVALSAFIGMAASEGQPHTAQPISQSGWERLFERLSGVETGADAALRAKSGYGGDDTNLGQPLRMDDGIVFVARTTEPSYWRGESKSVYTGRGWISADGESMQRKAPELSAPQTTTAGTENVPIGMPLESAQASENSLATAAHPSTGSAGAGGIVQDVLMNRGSRTDQLFALGPLLHVDALVAGSGKQISGDSVFANDQSGKYTVHNGLDSLAYYRIVTEPAVTDGSKLRQESSGYPSDVRTAYLQLPESLPKRVSELAAAVAKKAGNPYDKASAIAAFLRSNFAYSLDRPRMPGSSSDFVDNFLFEQKAGYCDHFSTAMVVMLRTLGIPARWVKGYAPGDAEPAGDAPLHPDTVALDAAGGSLLYEVTIRNRNAHSWVEVYFPDSGWVPFEPTPGFGGAAEADTSAKGVTLSARTPLQGVGQAAWADRFWNAGRQLAAAGEVWRDNAKRLAADGFEQLRSRPVPAAAALALLAAALLLWRLQRKRLALWLLLLRYPVDCRSSARMLRALDKLWAQVFRKFGRRRPDETLREYAMSRTFADSANREALLELTRLYEAIRYDSQQLRILPRMRVAMLWNKLLDDRKQGGS